MSLHTTPSMKPVVIGRPAMNPTLRRQIFGPLKPLQPSSWLERLLGR